MRKQQKRYGDNGEVAHLLSVSSFLESAEGIMPFVLLINNTFSLICTILTCLSNHLCQCSWVAGRFTSGLSSITFIVAGGAFFQILVLLCLLLKHR